MDYITMRLTKVVIRSSTCEKPKKIEIEMKKLCLEEVLSRSGLLSNMLEFDNDNSHIIRGMMRKGVFQQFVAGLLSVFDLANEFDCTLVADYIPKLRGVISQHNMLINSETTHSITG